LPVPIREVVGWAPQPAWTPWRRENILLPPVIEIPLYGHPGGKRDVMIELHVSKIQYLKVTNRMNRSRIARMYARSACYE